MRAFEILSEGRGIAARNTIAANGSGDIFANSRGEKIELVDVVYFPPERGYYQDDKKDTSDDTSTPVLKAREKAQQAVNQYLNDHDINKYTEVNPVNRAAAVTIWKHSDGSLEAFIRYTTSVNAGSLGIQWTNTQFANDTGYRIQDLKTESETVQIKPTDLINSESYLTVDQIIQMVSANIKTLDLPEDLKKGVPLILEQVAFGKTEPVPGLAKYQSVIDKYVGELAAPISCMTGNFATGDYRKAGADLLQSESWAGATHVNFPQSVREMLVDSRIKTKNGDSVGISSKAGTGGTKGAAASIASIVQTLKNRKDLFDPKFLNRYADTIEDLEIIYRDRSVAGVFKLAKKYNYITDQESDLILDIAKSFNNDESLLSGNLKKVLSVYPTTPASVEKSKQHPNYNLGYRLIAGLARLIAKKLNDRGLTPLFKQVLEKSSFVQIYAKSQKVGDALKFVEFKVVYPPVFDGEIVVDGDTNFYATDKPKGKFTFKIK